MTLLFNQIGERIYLVGDKTAGASEPDIYEAPGHCWIFKSQKIIKKKAEIKLNVSDILNQNTIFLSECR